ncbi:MAG: DinB family protein [Putridiphycobacter sp.]|nr:DinB family protein [Putridiphycobacter sp.]
MKNKEIERAISHLKIGRKTCLTFLEDLSFPQLIAIPTGFNNSIYWNIAHLVVTQQLLHYKLSGLETSLSDDFINDFRKGSTPRTDYTKADWEYVLEKFEALPLQLGVDYENGLFKNYSEYSTSFGVTLSSIEDAIAFNNIHEGLHIGYVMALKRLV